MPILNIRCSWPFLTSRGNVEEDLMKLLLKRLAGMVLAALIAFTLVGCTASKESAIKCSKCGASPAELQKQYEDRIKNQ
jgi:uncharacterized ferredoxin-like protein